ncbi:MAG: acyloxyacyl hydrolase [Bacteroidota bacterium]
MKHVAIIFAFLILTSLCAGQDKTDLSWVFPVDAAGMRIGTGFINELLPEKVTYNPILIQVFYQHSFRKKNAADDFSMLYVPQFNPVMISGKIKEYEFGVNLWLKYSHRFGKSIFYGAIGSGPHYISTVTRLQAKGFIFSDNFISGFSRPVGSNLFIDFQIRFRHISNANLQKPNLGIDNFLTTIGIYRPIGK